MNVQFDMLVSLNPNPLTPTSAPITLWKKNHPLPHPEDSLDIHKYFNKEDDEQTQVSKRISRKLKQQQTTKNNLCNTNCVREQAWVCL